MLAKWGSGSSQGLQTLSFRFDAGHERRVGIMTSDCTLAIWGRCAVMRAVLERECPS